jgi:nitronate monooxygenase
VNIREIFGIDLPIIQAPMAGVQGSELAVAVSSAGGLGSLPCAMLGTDQLRHELATIREQTTKPVNVNFFCHGQPRHCEQSDRTWRAALAPYYEELGVDPESVPAGPGRLPFGKDALEVLEEFRPEVVSFHFGLPSPDLLSRVKDWGARILSSATTVEEALWLEANGADAVIAQGVEAGGHRGHFLSTDLEKQMGTFALVPQVVQAVDLPVIAAGGISDTRAVSAAMILGAAGVQVGTAYLLCDEARTSEVHRAALKSDAARNTALTNVFSGRPARGIVNRIMAELGPMSQSAPEFPLATAAVAPLRSKSESLGLGDFSPLWAGQNTSGCEEISAGELTRKLASLVDRGPGV